jgi:hypothetical protein
MREPTVEMILRLTKYHLQELRWRAIAGWWLAVGAAHILFGGR